MNNSNHTGWKLSRNCIADTLLAKRNGISKCSSFERSLYNFTIRTLRETQLAPFEERKMVAGRYLEKQKIKSIPHDVVIVIRGGIVEEVRSNNPHLNIWIADYDNVDSDRIYELEDAEERGNMPDMNIVF